MSRWTGISRLLIFDLSAGEEDRLILHWKHSHRTARFEMGVPKEMMGLLAGLDFHYWENIVIEPFVASAKRRLLKSRKQKHD
jgi:hypothetical protein